MSDTLENLRDKRLIFAITPGRSGSKLLTALAQCVAGVSAIHEGLPRMNYLLRTICSHPPAAKWWLETEMFPTIAKNLSSDIYFETSHLFCKGFIEPTLDLGLKPSFIILTRPADEVAESLHAIGCIPERSGIGRMVLLGPSDDGVQELLDWQALSDYQLCYWYALEIERRQSFYEHWLPKRGCDVWRVQLKDLLKPNLLLDLAQFLTGSLEPSYDSEAAVAVLSQNQNPKSGLAPKLRLPPPQPERTNQERVIIEAFGNAPSC
jgi:hypothetical protein